MHFLLFPATSRATRRIFKMSANMEENFEPKITLETPLEDYKKHIQEKLRCDYFVDDDVMKANYKKIAAKIRETIWTLLFAEQPAKVEHLAKAGDCLYEHKMDACFHGPWEYNEWIPKVRDELLKREMLQFWRTQIVERELGPCWARDCDYFDDMDDKAPEQFYKYAGCVAAFIADQKEPEAKKTKLTNDDNAADDGDAASTPAPDDDDANFEDEISLETPLEDYKRLIKKLMQCEDVIDDEKWRDNYTMIADKMRIIIWELLFADAAPKEEQLKKAAACLIEHKMEAVIHAPFAYNDWIRTVRDELLKREMFEFWRDQMVKHELGLCWARDSDYFDDMDDLEPEEFYKRAGCVAVFSKEGKKQQATAESKDTETKKGENKSDEDNKGKGDQKEQKRATSP